MEKKQLKAGARYVMSDGAVVRVSRISKSVVRYYPISGGGKELTAELDQFLLGAREVDTTTSAC